MNKYTKWILILAATLLLPTLIFLPLSEAKRSNLRALKNKTASGTESRVSPKVEANSLQRSEELTPVVSQPVASGQSGPVRDFGAAGPESNKSSKRSNQEQNAERVINQKNEVPVKQIADGKESAPSFDFQLQSSQIVEPNIPATIANFEGLSSDDNLAAYMFRVMPPDTVGDVGPNHYVQATNLLVRVYNKTGAPLTAPFKMSSLFTPLGGVCANNDDGDPIVLYDPLADRWLLSQFATVADPNTHQCIAISTTGDPTGTYFVYDYMMPNNKFNDYPHFGVWPDAYYMSDNQFNQAGTAFLGAGVFAFDRKKMLAGDPGASFIYFDLFTLNPDFGGQLPVDLDGFVPPPNGTPGLFIEFNADEFGAGNQDELRIFEFQPNFTNPGASTFTQLPDLPLAAFDPRNPAGRSDIEQPPPATASTFLDTIGDRLMHRLAYRNLGTVASPIHSYVLNFTVNVSGVTPSTPATHQAGIRWTELRRSAAGVMSVNQEATYAPGAADPVNGRNIWMGSIAQDNQGNIGLGFSASSLTVFPSIIYTGRLATDPLNTLPQGEGTIIAGTGSQRGPNRWGDYSAMSVDPADDCTFWYTQEYYTAASSAASTFGWLTRVGSFKFAECTPAPKGTFSGVITDCATGMPVSGALVETTNPAGYIKFSDGSGNYSITAAPGTYNVRASKSGFGEATGMVTVTNGGNAILNLCLQPTAIIESAGATIVTESCSPANGAIDPDETVTVSLCVRNTGTTATTNLVGTLQATGGVTMPSGPQNYGAVGVNQTVCRNFTFTANGTCGGTITASLQLQDGMTNHGTVTYTFTLGTLDVAFSENFDGVTAPNLPAGWTAVTNPVPPNPDNCPANGGTSAPWATNTTTPDTAPNSAFTNDPACISDELLVSPVIAIETAVAQLSFRHNFLLEDGFDGGVLEIKIGAGAFTDILAAGGTFAQGGYTGTISTTFFSPIAGRQAWEGSSGGYITTRVNLPAAAMGQNIQLRFRRATDESVSSTGWRVDTVLITDGFDCCEDQGGPCTENFDGVTAPALPPGWSANTALDCVNSNPWATSSAGTPAPPADTAPNSAFVNDPNCISDERLESPSFPIVSTSAQLTFRNNFDMENGFDGGVLEIKIGAGAFQDILAAGGTFATGGYNGMISTAFGSPIAGRQAWTGNSGGFITTTVNLPASANGQNIVLRWRRGTDSSVSDQGWRIDTLSITGSNCDEGCMITCPNPITVSNDPNECGAVVNYPPPTTTGTCGPVTCSPASGSFFPVGTTIVTCTTTAGPSCSFTITVNQDTPATPSITAGPATIVNESCPPDNGQIDVGERVTVHLQLQNTSSCPTNDLVATLVQGGGVTSPSNPQSYGAVGPGLTGRDFTFTAIGSCGGTLTATWNLNDGPTNLGTVTKTFTLACIAPSCGMVRLVVVLDSFTRTNPTTVRARYRVRNIGTLTADDVTLTNARLGSTTGGPVPTFIGDVPPDTTSPPFDVFFTNSTPGASSTLTLGGTYTGGTFTSTRRVTVP